MADARSWPALLLEAPDRGCNYDDIVSLVLDDYQPAAIEDLVELPVPPGGIWDPTAPLPDTAASAPLRWRVYFRAPIDRDLALAALAGQCPALRCTPVEVPDEDWAARSQRSLTAIRIGDFLIAPPWDLPAAVPPGVTCIVIEPSMGFGTGHHQSTRLCLRALSTQTLAGRQVLDLGTGSGVLALAAASRGATVKALDVDPYALASAQAGAALNPGLPGVEWLVGDFRLVQMPPADVVLANLTGGLLIQAAPSIRRLVRPGGQLIVSGFLDDEVEDVRTALALTICRRLSEDGWVALVLQHETSVLQSVGRAN